MKKYLRKKLRKILGIDKFITDKIRELNPNIPKIINCEINNTNLIADLAFLMNSKLGEYSNVGRYSNVLNAEVGKFCEISYFCTVGATPHYLHRISTSAFPYIEACGFVNFDKRITDRVMLGNDVWIGTTSIILPNVKIGDGAVVGAGSVVTKDVPPYAIVAGAPAKIINYRFSENIIKQLLEIKWWDFDKEVIKENIHLFQKDITEETIQKLIELKGSK